MSSTTITTTTYEPGSFECAFLGNRAVIAVPPQFRKYDDPDHPVSELNRQLKRCHGDASPLGANLMTTRSFPSPLDQTGSVNVVQGANQEQLVALMAATSRSLFNTRLVQVIRPGGYISAASLGDCEAIAAELTAVTYEKHHLRLVDGACKFSTTTTTVTSTTITSTTRTTATTTTAVTFQFACAGKSSAGDKEQLLVVHEGLACETATGVGMVDQLEDLVQVCTGSSHRPDLRCSPRAHYAGGGVPVLGLTPRMVATIAAKVAHSLMVPMPADIATCFCKGESVNGDGAADCSSKDNGVPYCMTERGACSDGKQLAFFRTDLDYSQRACAYWMETGTLQFKAPPETCSAVAVLLNVALNEHRSGRMHQCTPISTSPTSTGTTTPTTTATTTTLTTTPTTTPTTSTTPTTTPTTTEACRLGQFLDPLPAPIGGPRCKTCPSGQWQDEISQPKCNKCSALPKGSFEVAACTPSTDAVHAPCTVCNSAAEYAHSACGANADTVCAPITDCQRRCIYHPEVDVCWAATSKEIACEFLTPTRSSSSSSSGGTAGNQLSCQAPDFDPSAADRCMYQSEMKRCITKHSMPVADGSGCPSFPEYACRQSQAAGGKCVWDDLLYGCRDKQCNDIHVPSACSSSSLGCKYDEAVSYCHQKGSETPCSAFTSRGFCEDSGLGDRCVFSKATGLCRANVAIAGRLPCRFYNGEDVNKCPSERCTLDPHANLCREQHEATPCEAYSKLNCPVGVVSWPGVISMPEFMRTPATATTDVQCQFVGKECDTATMDDGTQQEFTAQAATATSDVVCEAITTCDEQDEFEEVAPTPSTDRTCAKATASCIEGEQFETHALTPTSDRQCSVLSDCDHLETDGNGDATEYVLQEATATSNRVCALLAVCSPTERQEYESEAATKHSNRVCTPFTSCEAGAEFQSSGPTGTSDRSCTRLTVCASGQEYEGTPPLGGSAFEVQVLVTNRICLPITQCPPPGEYAATPASPTSDATCAAATAPCDAASGAEYEAAALTPTSDRVCRGVTVCNMTAYSLADPTPTSDRVCNSAFCPSNQYRTGVDQETKQLICVDRSAPCDSYLNEYEEVAGTSTTDRVCATFKCAKEESYLPDGVEVQPENCIKWSECPSGIEFEKTPPSVAADRVCNPISAYCDVERNGYFELSGPTPTSDRVCKECSGCADGFKIATACAANADTECTECSDCLAGEYAVSNCTDTTPSTCSICTRCLPGHFHVVKCSPYTNADCKRCSRCIDGTEYTSAACSADADTVCTLVDPPCNWPVEFEAEMPTETSQRVCRNVTQVCLDNEWEVAGPTLSSDRNCSVHSECKAEWCPRSSWNVIVKSDADADDDDEWFEPGRWLQSNSACTAPASSDKCIDFGYDPEFESRGPSGDWDRICTCPSFDVCPPGSYEHTPPSATNDRLCIECSAGTFQNQPGEAACKPIRNCSSDGYEWQYAAPTLSSDRICRAVSACPTEYETFETQKPNTVADRVCENVTQCDQETQFEYVPPTPTSNRFCETISMCKPKQYQAKAPSETSPRVCAQLAVCTSKQWECAEPVVVAINNSNGKEVNMNAADRKCCSHSACSDGQFIQTKATETADTVCQDYRVCNATEYESRAGTAYTNRKCSPITDCAARKAGQTERFEIKSATATSDAVCAIATVCPAGTHERTAPQPGADRTCRDCNGVTQWQNVSGQAECIEVAKCNPRTEFMAQLPTKTADGVCVNLAICGENEYASTPHTASTDRKCSQCRTCDPRQQWTEALPCTLEDNAECRLATICTDGEFELTPLTSSNDRACQKHRVCRPEEYTDRIGTPTRDAFCAELQVCSPGSFEMQEATATSDRSCKACERETSFSLIENAPRCTNCTVGCPPGTFAAVQCTQLADTICEACPYGSFSSSGSACTPWMGACPAGTAEIYTPNSFHDRGCVLCPQGSFRSVGSALSGSKACVPHTRCAPGYRSANVANSTTNVVCEPVPTTTSTATTTTITTGTETTTTETTTTETLFRLAERSQAASAGAMTNVLYIAAAVVGIMVLALLYLCCDCRGIWDNNATVAKKGGGYAGSTAIDVAALRRRQELEDAELQADMVRHEKQIKIMRENPNAIKRSRRPSVHRQSQVIEFEGTEVSEL